MLTGSTTETSTVKQQFFSCDCNAEGVLLSKFDDEDDIYLAIYTYGQFHSKPTIWNRIKYCWHHLTTGRIYQDQIVLDSKTAKKLANWIIKNR